jgi:hypothetical protein
LQQRNNSFNGFLGDLSRRSQAKAEAANSKPQRGDIYVAQGKRKSLSAPPWVRTPKTQAADCEAARQREFDLRPFRHLLFVAL